MKDFSNFRGKLVRSYPLASKTTWRVGGIAEIYAEPRDEEDLFCLLATAKRLSLPLYVLGRGSNLLIDDKGVPGITISLKSSLNYIFVEEDNLIAGAAIPMPALAKYVCRIGFSGFEHLIGIPGTVGAGVIINAGKGTGNDMDMRNILTSVTYIKQDLSFETLEADKLHLGYRNSCLKDTSNIVMEAKFSLKNQMDTIEIEKRQKEILAERRKKFPLNLPNAGSVFKRPENAPPAGKLIETAGLKGYQIGGAQVSNIHANFIVNLGNATAQDIKNLIAEIVEKVFVVHGIKLEREVVYWPDQANWE